MGTQEPSSDRQRGNALAHRDDVLDDLTIIQAQAQLMMRRLQERPSIDHEDVRRLGIMVGAVQRLARMHRSS